MKRKLARFCLSAVLLFGVTSIYVGCSSSSSGEEDVASAEASDNESAADPSTDTNQATENENLADGNVADSSNPSSSSENPENPEGAESNIALNQDAEGGNAAVNNPVANNSMGKGGDEDLNQIIDEMNSSAGNQLPAQQGGAQGFENVAGAEANQPAPDTAAATPESSANAAMPATTSGTPGTPGLPEMGSKMSYIVQKGDTLAKIAQRILGDGKKWTEIANFTGIANPRLIYPGDVVYYQLTEKSVAFATTYESSKRSEVKVSQGDTLATIAGRVLGNSSLWKLIWRQNDNIANPDQLTTGTTLFYIEPSQMVSKTDELSKNQIVKKGKVSTGKKLASVKKPNSSKSLDVSAKTKIAMGKVLNNVSLPISII